MEAEDEQTPPGSLGRFPFVTHLHQQAAVIITSVYVKALSSAFLAYISQEAPRPLILFSCSFSELGDQFSEYSSRGLFTHFLRLFPVDSTYIEEIVFLPKTFFFFSNKQTVKLFLP